MEFRRSSRYIAFAGEELGARRETFFLIQFRNNHCQVEFFVKHILTLDTLKPIKKREHNTK